MLFKLLQQRYGYSFIVLISFADNMEIIIFSCIAAKRSKQAIAHATGNEMHCSQLKSITQAQPPAMAF
jgi:hypothetical protein